MSRQNSSDDMYEPDLMSEHEVPREEMEGLQRELANNDANDEDDLV